ncbi:MAG: hypothetical protein JXB49_16600 [Bacteroidales bacterium]|nr:hypothetical protein [Bacteroidales bacterium]
MAKVQPENIKSYLILTFFLLLSSHNGFAQKFFEVETIDQAEIKVYYEMEDANCDLKVCFVYEAKDITKVGLWMEVPTASEADIKIIFVDDPSLADIHICVGDSPAQAGWLNPAKSKLIKF